LIGEIKLTNYQKITFKIKEEIFIIARWQPPSSPKISWGTDPSERGRSFSTPYGCDIPFRFTSFKMRAADSNTLEGEQEELVRISAPSKMHF
jgi:hypothetical protein